MKTLKFIYYRLLWHIAPFLPNGKLVHVDIEINNNCNQKCIFCWHSSKEKNFKNTVMLTNDVYHHIHTAAGMGAKSIKFNLRGEPTTNQNLVGYVRLASYLGFTDIMINTNGILLDTILLFKLDRAGLTTCIISIDSLVEENYCKLHGVSKYQFNTLKVNLNIIKNLKATRRINMDILLNFHINEINEAENFDQYKRQLSPLKCKFRYTQARKGQNISIDDRTKLRKKNCPHMMRRLTVTANGKIYPCCLCYDEPLDIALVTSDLDDAWHSQKRKALIKNYRDRFYTDSCKECASADIYYN